MSRRRLDSSAAAFRRRVCAIAPLLLLFGRHGVAFEIADFSDRRVGSNSRFCEEAAIHARYAPNALIKSLPAAPAADVPDHHATRAAVGSLGRIGVEVDEVLVVPRLVVGGCLALWLRFRSLLAKAH